MYVLIMVYFADIYTDMSPLLHIEITQQCPAGCCVKYVTMNIIMS